MEIFGEPLDQGGGFSCRSCLQLQTLMKKPWFPQTATQGMTLQVLSPAPCVTGCAHTASSQAVLQCTAAPLLGVQLACDAINQIRKVFANVLASQNACLSLRPLQSANCSRLGQPRCLANGKASHYG